MAVSLTHGQLDYTRGVSRPTTRILPEGSCRTRRASEMGETDFLSGGGELGERIRNHDWAVTSVG
jgi:hypothetical protein